MPYTDSCDRILFGFRLYGDGFWSKVLNMSISVADCDNLAVIYDEEVLSPWNAVRRNTWCISYRKPHVTSP